jgi:hypothetical protein
VWVWARLCKLKNECTRLAAASDKVCHLLAYGRLFSPGIPASSTTKTDRHDIAEILLKVELNTRNQIKSNNDKRITRPSKTSVCLTRVMINTITTLSVIISCCSYCQITLLRFCVFCCCFLTVADFWVSCLSTLVLFLQKLDLALQAFDCERT